MGTDLSVVNAARVSFDKESDWTTLEIHQGDKLVGGVQVLNEADRRLISYLAKHKHFSPFNHAFMTFRVKAPIFVARQLVKHKFMPWNEVSRRYVDSEPEFYIAPMYRAKAANVKQGSADVDSGYDRHAAIEHSQRCLDEYNARLAHGVCPEQARDALPINTHTEWIWSGTLGAFADMLKLRLDPHTQAESRIVAEQIYAIAADLFPVSLPSLIENK